jgi:hypothetical protein
VDKLPLGVLLMWCLSNLNRAGEVMRKAYSVGLVLLVLVMVACSRGAQATPTVLAPTVVWTATPLPPGSELPITPIATNTPAVPQPTEVPTWVATVTLPPSPTAAGPTASPTPGPELYSVAFVLSDDVLNVRSEPGVDSPKLGSLAPNDRDVEITGEGQVVDPSLWVPIQADGLSGWVNSRFLTAQVKTEDFCQDPRVQAIVDNLRATIQLRDGQALAALVHPQRGLRLRHSWWNNEIKLVGGEVSRVFTDPTKRDWGREDGSGIPIVGSFEDAMLPLLDKDLVGATESVCGQIVGGDTAGIIRLPAEYEAVNIQTAYRPAPADGPSNDWGSWGIGIEFWRGQPYLSFLVHYTWEI